MVATSNDILVFGATGTIGKFILNALIENKSAFGTIGIFTSAATTQSKAVEIESLKDRGVKVYIGDLKSDGDVLSAYQNFDTILSAVGRDVILDQIRLIELAEKSANIKRFFPSEYGTDIEYGPNSEHERPHQAKLKVRRFIRENIKRVEYTYIVTGPYADLYIGSFKRRELGTFDVVAKKAVLLGDGDGKISLTTMADVGKQVVAALKHPDVARNRALKLNSFTTTPKDILAEFEKQTGTRWDTSFVSLPELEQAERDAWGKGDPAATSFTLRRIWTQGGTLYGRRDNESIDAIDMETLPAVVEKAIRSGTPAFQSGQL